LRTSEPDRSRIHKVSKGESPWTIAAKYDVSVDEFLAWNNLDRSAVLRVGDEYTVTPPTEQEGTPAAESTPTGDTSPQKIVHVVKPGQNPTTIARSYGVDLSDLFKWNGWSEAPVLQVGSEIVIYK